MLPRRKVRVLRACVICRRRKRKCSGDEPCQHCKRGNLRCIYREVACSTDYPRNDEIMDKIDYIIKMMEGGPRHPASHSASTPNTAASDAGEPATLEQCMDNEEPLANLTQKRPKENPDSSALASSFSAQYLVPGPNAAGSLHNPIVSTPAALPSQEIRRVVPVIHPTILHGVDTFLGFHISLPDNCLTRVPNGQQMLSGCPILMSCLVYDLTYFTYGPSWPSTETKNEVQDILEYDIRPAAAAILPNIPDCDSGKRLVELTSLLGMEVLLSTGQKAYLRGLYPSKCLVESEARSWVEEGDIVGLADNLLKMTWGTFNWWFFLTLTVTNFRVTPTVVF
ncbi:hypothetical protein K469DRAFT_756312 [Zopfia rhizophila CBS 207.26]|uniref:Zn(2)-C6 fungal-type domain-containing protein n=1 Tax=Zopfia rhizophila CBS 207.26 TaxID=1314779 RepID=A0A6A6DA03_9PEZI|nr:hypothetical protein K469DRAFT_756312 [Zopfia rhizophila CBS 207.26]